MAFGGSGNEIELKARLETGDAEQQARKLRTDIESSFKGISSAASNPTAALKDLTRSLIDANPKAAALATQVEGLGSKLSKVAPYAIAATAATAGLALAFKGLISVAGDGDRFGDIAEAFEANAAKAGVLADELRDNLSKAFLDTVNTADLMTAANKAFAVGISPAVFDDLASAAKRYADATGGDAKQALDQLILGVNSGREALLRKFGTVKDGVLVLDAFTQKTYETGQANSNVTDTYEQFTASLRNTYNEVARAVNESEALKLVTQAVSTVVVGLAKAVGSAVTAFVDFTNSAIRYARSELQLLSNGFAVLGEIVGQLRSGELPSLSKAQAAVGAQLAKTSKEAEKAEKVMVKLGKGTDGAAKAATNFKKQIAEALQQSDVGLNDLFGIESFVLPGTADGLRTKLKTAFKQVNPNDIIADLKGLRGAFLDGLTGTPEEIAEEARKRISIFDAELQKAKKEVESGVTIGAKVGEGDKKDAAVFGFESGDEIASQFASSIESALIGALQSAAQGLSSGDGKAAIDSMVSTVGAAVGTALGTAFGGPAGGAAGGAIGSNFAKYTVVGAVIGKVVDVLGKEGSGTTARKAADRFFADIFQAERLAVVVGDQIKRINDLVFQGGTTFGGQGGGGGPTTSFLQSLPAEAQAAFQAVGGAFEELLGVSGDISGQIGAVLANNIGGSLEALQVLVQTTGRTFEELGDQIIQAFYEGTLSIEEAAAQLEGLQELFTPGIPGAVGDIAQAVSNLQIALADGKGSRILLDSLRDIGAEALELGFKEFPQAASAIEQAFGFSAQQVAQFFQAMKTIGLANMTDLVNASAAQLIELGKAVNQITSGQAVAVQNITDPTAPSKTQVGGLPGNFSAGGFRRAPESSGGGSKNTKGDQAAKKREQEFQSVYKLLTASAQYDRILDRIQDKELKRGEANKAIAKLYADIAKASKAVTDAEEKYQAALKKGNDKALSDMAKKLGEAEAKLKDLTKTSKEAEKAVKFDLSGVTPLIDDLNKLGTLSRALGVNIAGVTNALVAGFLRGKISVAEFGAELRKSESILGKGIPEKVGATSDAFKNLIEGGLKGGIFSVDAFQDIFAEFKEQFAQQSSASRKAQLAELTKTFDATNKALQDGINSGRTPEEIDNLRKRAEGAKKALEDFKSAPVKAGFEDLRSELAKTFDPEQVRIFFRGLEQSGITTFDGFETASNEAVAKILVDLNDLGFGFGETSQRVKDILAETDKAIVQAQGGKDVLQTSLDIIGKFNEAIGVLPGQAEAGNSALEVLGKGFDDIITRIALLDGNTFENTLVFNVKTNGTAGEKALIDALYGDGSSEIDVTVDGGPGLGGGGGLTTAQKREFFDLRRRKKNGKLSGADQRRFDELNSLRPG